jgi:hypothetical protein
MAIKKKIQWPDAPDRTSAVNQKLADSFFEHHNPYTHKSVRNKYNIIKYGEEERVEECREMVVHTFTMGDVEDPDLYAAQPLYEWQQSEFGQWVMKNAADTPTWHRHADFTTYGYQYQIRAKFMGPRLTELLLRQGSK